MIIRSRPLIRNALFGMAIADATGAPFEFDFIPTPQEVLEYSRNPNKNITDDTQMTLFGFQAVAKILSGSSVEPYSIFVEEYLNWYDTQINSIPNGASWLNKKGLMYNRRWPGGTCLSALKTHRDGKSPVNDSLGCGAVMRLLPVVQLFDTLSYEEVLRIAEDSALTTHCHPDIIHPVRRLMGAYYDALVGDEVKFLPAKDISDLGGGWVSDDCVEMAIWAYCNSETFDELLVKSICHGGDSDSVAAVAGSLWGLSGKEVPELEFKERELLEEFTA